MLEECRQRRLTRNQHILFRLGELIAAIEGAGALVRRAAAAAEQRLPAKADRRFTPECLAVLSRIAARDAAQLIAQQGLRWVWGSDGGASDAEGLEAVERALRLADLHCVQTGLLADMDRAADIVYDREGAPANPPVAAGVG